MTAPAPRSNARNTVAGGRDAFVVGREVAGTAVGGVVTGSGGDVGVRVGEGMTSTGSGVDACISGLSVYEVPVLIDTRDALLVSVK